MEVKDLKKIVVLSCMIVGTLGISFVIFRNIFPGLSFLGGFFFTEGLKKYFSWKFNSMK